MNLPNFVLILFKEVIFYLETIDALNKENVRYLVAGGVAATLYGLPRMTIDLDIIVDMERENLLNLLNALKSLGMKPAIPLNPDELLSKEKRDYWQKEKNMVVFSFENPQNPFKIVDIILNPPIPFESMYKRRNIIKVKDKEIPTVSIEDLIKMKSISGREQDIIDVKFLKEIHHE